MLQVSKGKILLIIGILALLIGIPAAIFIIKQPTAFRLGAQDPNKPENVQISGIEEGAAVITWSTKKATQSVISYGLSPLSLTLIQPEVAPAINHRVNLERLLPNSNYFFVIKVGEKIFDNNGQPYQFTTLAKIITPTPEGLTEQGLMKVMGTNNPIYDLNKDGVVNVVDLQLLREQAK